ncbi:MAG: histidine kinase [Desulfobacterales bacterium GWB2_56_26]|nr:MAG: histidine kinase [Desulfobacterales bacterium GWB2_56_26]HBG20027.1 histidine kinase [Desulfobulbaceae bacterium]
MVEILLPEQAASTLSSSDLLGPGEVVAVVDDSPEIVLLLSHYLGTQAISIVKAGSARELLSLLATEKIALVLLDIGLPDRNGNEILKEIVPAHPDLGIIMVTGTTDIEVALDCLRHGADDYLTKPINISQFTHTVQNTLKKRRLAISSRQFQQELEKTNARMRFLHHLNLKMNTAYLNTFELRGILQAILVGITSEDGLRFNRAFLALYNDNTGLLHGTLAIGPSSREEAGRVWSALKEKGLQLDDILSSIQEKGLNEDIEVNKIIQTLRVSPASHDHVLIHASRINKPVHVVNGKAPNCIVPDDLINLLGESTFVVAPLRSPSKSLGVMIVDNFITGAPISDDDIAGLEIFASQASLAIEHSHLYAAMAEQIAALELVTHELEKSKNLLIEAERTATIGQMSAQLLHAIRNPLTSIGGTARLLTKKSSDPYMTNFLNIITQESNKIETILEDLFSFVEDNKIQLEMRQIYTLIRKTVMIFYITMKQNNIEYTLDLDGPGPTLPIDENKIRQVFLHLIRNSLEAMPTGGSLRIAAEETDKSVTIHIIDSGPGIPMETLPHVKDPFFTTKTYGNGMGLALVEQIVQQHGGTFTIRDAPKGGTLATVNLPKHSPIAAEQK